MSSDSSSPCQWDPPPPEELQRLLPQYEITGRLGRGGMGAVYEGRQVKLNRRVAIKVLPETCGGGHDPMNFARRFEQEAQAMANLDHPAIISVHDFGETSEGQLYFVMEFVDGMDIHQYLEHQGGKLSQAAALAITAHVLDALAYAHSQGIVHRDIKPANVLLNRDGRVKVVDFGLAKKSEVDDEDVGRPTMTGSDVALGTPDYVAPEALETGRVPDHRADLYAVGVMLYKMLTGKVPRGQFKLPSQLDPEIDPRIDELVSGAMQSDPDERYANASDVRADLDRILSQPLERVRPGESSSAVAPAVEAIPTGRTDEDGDNAAGTAVDPAGRARFARRQKPRTWVYAGIGAVAGLVALTAFVIGTTGEADETTGGPAVDAQGDDVTPEQARPARRLQALARKRREGRPPGVPAGGEATADSPVDVAGSGGSSPGDRNRDLIEIPGLRPRLQFYLSARQRQLSQLAARYETNLNARMRQAAVARDGVWTEALVEERRRLTGLVEALAAPVGDPVAAVSEPMVLPELASDAPEELVKLRKIWVAERQEMDANLVSSLLNALKTLEAKLTRARQLTQARAVAAFAESLDGS